MCVYYGSINKTINAKKKIKNKKKKSDPLQVPQ